VPVISASGSADPQKAHSAVDRPTYQCDLPQPGQRLTVSTRKADRKPVNLDVIDDCTMRRSCKRDFHSGWMDDLFPAGRAFQAASR
jgi:hypothetical protein